MRLGTAVVSALIALSLSQPPTLHAAASGSQARRSIRPPSSTSGVRSSARLSGSAPRVYGPPSRASVSDGAGGVYIAWADIRDGSGDIFLTRLTSSGTVAPGWPADGVPVCNAPGDQFESIIIPDASDGVIVGWLDFRSDWMTPAGYVQRVNSAGTALWAANGVLVINDALNLDPQLAPDGTGGVLLAWSEMGATDMDLLALRLNNTGALAAGWSASGNVVCGLSGDQLDPSLIGDGAGGAFLAWDDGRTGGETHVFIQKLNASGVAQWTANGVQLDSGSGDRTEPSMCTDGSTGAIIHWIDYASSDLIVGQRVNSAGVAQWTAGGLGLGGSASLDGVMSAVSDGIGGAIVTWDERPLSVAGLRAQRVNGSGVEQWGASGAVVVGIASSDPYLTEFFPDGIGGAYFLWEDFRNGATPHAAPDIYAQRVSNTGTVSWTANGVAVCSSAGEQNRPTGATDGSFGLVVAWLDQRNFDPDVFVQHFSPGGVAQLAANGVSAFGNTGVQVGESVVQTNDGGALVFINQKRAGQWDIVARKMNADGSAAAFSTPICVAAGHQGISMAIDDGAGGAIVAWTDRRSGEEDIYAQRVDINGTPQWTANGVAICTASGPQQSPVMATDGAGGAILAWQDDRGNSDIYAQRVNSLGVVQWTADGVALVSDINPQQGVVIASDNALGAIIAWGDLRNFLAPAIYAQRLDAAGTPLWTAGGVNVATFGIGAFPRVVSAVPGTANDAIVLASEPVLDFITYDVTSILRAQRVSSAGGAMWGASGTPVCDVSSLCSHEHMVGDGAGGAYVAWADGRGSIYDLYMQRLNQAGVTQWTDNGEVVCDAAGWQVLDGLTRDPAGDEYLVWEDSRGGLPDIWAQRVNPSGVAQWAANGVKVCGAARGQYFSGIASYKTAAPARLFIAWTDNRLATERYVYMQRLDLSGVAQWAADGTTSTSLAMVSASAEADRVRLAWYASDPVTATIQRRTGAEDWRDIGSASSDGSGLVSFEDRDVVPGTRYGYRLAYQESGQQAFAGEVWVEVPTSLRFALEGLRPNPAVGALVVSFTLPASDAALLELVDVTGRRVMSREVGGLAPGRHTLRLDGAVPAAGIYFIKLTQNGRTLTERAAVLK